MYHQSSLKAEARCKRGKAIRRSITATSKTPSNWQSFLRDSTNKTELFHFLADKVGEMTKGHPVITTKGEHAITTTSDTSVNLEEVTPCTHEEADMRIFVHARHAATEGYKSLMIEANDTDIIVIVISPMPSLAAIGLEKMWVAFGKGEHRRWIPIHELVSAIGPEKASGMLFFYAFTGCDVVSSFNAKRKKIAWQTWNVCNEASVIFTKLSQCPSKIEESDLQILDKCVVLMYDRSSSVASVNEASLPLFARKQRSLKEHTKRAAYEAGHIWSQAIVRQPEPQCLSDWGWFKEDDSEALLDCPCSHS